MNKLTGNITVRRFCTMLLGIVLMGLGVSLFKLSLLGNDPSNAMAMAIGEKTGLSFAVTLYIINGIWFCFELLLGKRHIGIGTFVNWFCVGVISSLFTKCLTGLSLTADGNIGRFSVMLVGVLILSLACSLYQTADVGISPYDSVAIILHERFSRVPYLLFRITIDSIGAAITYLLGGIVGLGTLACALGLGPFISFFDVHLSRKLCGIENARCAVHTDKPVVQF